MGGDLLAALVLASSTFYHRRTERAATGGGDTSGSIDTTDAKNSISNALENNDSKSSRSSSGLEPLTLCVLLGLAAGCNFLITVPSLECALSAQVLMGTLYVFLMQV